MGQVAGELMAIESWRDFPILVTVVIINRSKVDATVEARQKYRKEQKDRELKDLEKLGQGQFDLQEELIMQKEVLRQKILDHGEKQGNLCKAVEQLTEKVTKLETPYPDNILLPAIQKSIIGKAKSVIRHLGPSYTVDEVITVLTQEYEGVTSSDMIFKDF